MEVNKTLNDEIWNYCRTNNITNIDEFMLKCLQQGFTVEKFGATPSVNEKIIQVEVEKIIEVPVEKEVYITDDKEMQKFTDEIKKLNKVVQITAENKDKALNELAQKEIELKKIKLELELEKKKNKTDLYGE